MTSTPRNRRIDTASDRLYRASPAVIAALDHLDRQRALVPAIGSSRTDGAGSSKGGHSDRTLAITVRLDGIDYGRRTIVDAIATVELATDVLDQAVRDAYKINEQGEATIEDSKPRCIGDNSAEGATCWNIPSPRRNPHGLEIDDGRCVDCGPRYDALAAQRRSQIEQNRRLRRGAA